MNEMRTGFHPIRKKFILHNLMLLVFIFSLVLFPLLPKSNTYAQTITTTPDSPNVEVLNKLSPEEKVGQLFLITFNGTDVGPESTIFNLITNYHVGNVVILAENDNLTHISQSPGDTALQLRSLTRKLQQIEWSASQESQNDPTTGEPYLPSYIPLFIGMPQEGDGYPYDQVLYGLSQLPNHMALGATWNRELATEVGATLGIELSSVGVNLLLGPSLDVLETPQFGVTKDLGTRIFGGDPYWVGEMGQAYIKGIHSGSQGRVAVVSKHFPGHGGADRLPEDEVATVRKSIEELIAFDLYPFFTVTGKADSSEGTTDALLTSHIRYQGLQGNIRATTRPVSLDPQALSLLMELPEFELWRNAGGVMITDNLNSLAVRRFYDLTSQNFDIYRVALNAFLAGNDLLYINDVVLEDDVDAVSATQQTLEFFSQKYREDNAFASRVDESVLRILDLKQKLYGEFSIGQVLAAPQVPTDLEQSQQIVFEVARQAATLVSPSQTELDETIPDPPNQDDRIVFISDTREAKQCSQCVDQPILGVKSLQEFVIRRYGPQAGGQVSPYNMTSYALSDLLAILDEPTNGSRLASDLQRANWIVFSMLDNSEEMPSFDTLSRFLNERPDLFQQKRLIVFSFNAPYFMDATNISKLTAYYSLFSKTAQFIDMASYLLFREIQPMGASPVSIPGINYDLNKALFPNPEQIIPLELDIPQDETDIEEITPEPTQPPEFYIGDVIPLRTGTIFDNNGHPVPDGTPVDFVQTLIGEASSTRQTETTSNGIARTTFVVTVPGTLEFLAESEPAQSETLRIDIPSPNGELTPTTENLLPEITPSPTATEEFIIPPTKPPIEPEIIQHPRISDWIIASLISIGIGWILYRLAAFMGLVKWGVRTGLLALIGGLTAYSILAYLMPKNEVLVFGSISRSVFLITLFGIIIGAITAILWRSIADRKVKKMSMKEKT